MKMWKGPSFIFISGLILMILVLPTLIVVPFIQHEPMEVVTDQTASTEATDEYNLEGNPAFVVSVLRDQANQVEEVPLELYVSRVVASEMPADFELEALKAQALAARTYIVRYLVEGEEKLQGGADVTDTVQHQVYKNDAELRQIWGADYEWKMPKIRQAVGETMGEILTFEGDPIFAAFFSTSNGQTENSEDYWQNEIPYLRSVASPWDETSPKYLDQKVFSEAQMEQLLAVTIDSSKPVLANVEKTESNRISKATIGDKTLTGREIRESLDLQSSDFTVEHKDGHFVFTTKGYGHGVGMSQFGANGMAQEGKSYKEIVTHFYKGVAIEEVDSYLPKMAAK
ncbi:stage II sporulation protein D [Pontibacillus salipaludis]|uniref:stage II sporulation protein D n=1 Tax=Pontibacillus salipaludis TaxID=1697394 RepID=UPI0031E5C26C